MKQTSFNLQVRQLDINRFMMRFVNITWHLPDMTAEELKKNPKIIFVGTRRPDLEKPLVEMEVHMDRVGDVAEEVRVAAEKQEFKLRELDQLLDRAFMSYGV